MLLDEILLITDLQSQIDYSSIGAFFNLWELRSTYISKCCRFN